MGQIVQKIGVVTNFNHHQAEACLEVLKKLLERHHLRHVESNILFGAGYHFDPFQQPVDIVILIGGDGTFLSVARKFADKSYPIFGINTGNLGFLTQGYQDNLENSIQRIAQGDFSVEERTMLEITDSRDLPTWKMLALNDVVIKNSEFSRMANMELVINNLPVNRYKSDGLIIATPTGSTAYTLAAGGPIVHPFLDAFVIVPICPQSLTSRPIVVPDTEDISINLENKNNDITIDGQENIKLGQGDSIYITKAKTKTKLILFDPHHDGFYITLKKKLSWGILPGVVS